MPTIPTCVREIIGSLILGVVQSQIFNRQMPTPLASVCLSGSISLIYYYYRNRNNAMRRRSSPSNSRRTIIHRSRSRGRRIRTAPTRRSCENIRPRMNFDRPLPINFRRHSV
ncbi:unnamed protein product [Ceutorhynchus assimilis]|uniref:Uncharacterized protein n=1 Tax=Ceutorhynchus assimilis TaxID=467358 RepID=A0A9N9MIH9_9CUCU|nr:unnamed protein product [Ceutorhynchus assimilis]